MNPYYPGRGCGRSAAMAAAEPAMPGSMAAPVSGAEESSPFSAERVALSEENLMSPAQEDLDTQAMQGSMQQLLSDYLGLYVICEFIVGTQGMLRKEGILFNVGRSTITLYDDVNQEFIVCDVFSLKFVTFYQPGQRPGQISNQVPMVNVPGVGSVPAGPYGLGTGDTRPTVGRRSRMW